jgi:hypothetical protein
MMCEHHTSPGGEEETAGWLAVRGWLAGRAALVALALVAWVLVGQASVAAARPTARPARACTPPRYPGRGTFTSLIVSGVSCTEGGRAAVAYYHCRTRSGPRGYCSGGVFGYRCTELRKATATSISGRVACRRDRNYVVHTFRQNG